MRALAHFLIALFSVIAVIEFVVIFYLIRGRP